MHIHTHASNLITLITFQYYYYWVYSTVQYSTVQYTVLGIRIHSTYCDYEDS